MKSVLILALTVLVMACSSTPNVEESQNVYANDDIDTIEDIDELEDVDDIQEISSVDDVKDDPMEEGLMDQQDKPMEGSQNNASASSGASLSPEQEIHNLRLEIEELKSVIAGLKHTATPVAHGPDFNEMQDNTVHVRPVDLVMRFNSKHDQKRWWNILEDAGIKDKFYSASKGNYIIFLGHFNNHKVALATKNKIIEATGANMIEIITSSRG
jgi:hypothetical protein